MQRGGMALDQYDFFWRMMELCDWERLVHNKDILVPLIRLLSKLPDEEIFSFDDIMAELLYILDTRKLFIQCKKVNPNAGDRMFLNARCAALTGGKKYYEKVKVSKMKMIWGRTWEADFDVILQIPSRAWALKHHKHPNDYPHKTPLCYKTGSNKDEWK